MNNYIKYTVIEKEENFYTFDNLPVGDLFVSKSGFEGGWSELQVKVSKTSFRALESINDIQNIDVTEINFEIFIIDDIEITYSLRKRKYGDYKEVE